MKENARHKKLTLRLTEEEFELLRTARWTKRTSLQAAGLDLLLNWAKDTPEEGRASTSPKLYTSKQLREAAAAEIINCMGLAKDAFHPAIREYGRTLVIRIPIILDAAEDPQPPDETLLKAMLELGREKLRELLPGFNPKRPS